MLYSSGTTGRPKGIKYNLPRTPAGEMPANLVMLTALFGFTETPCTSRPRRCTTRRRCSIA